MKSIYVFCSKDLELEDIIMKRYNAKMVGCLHLVSGMKLHFIRQEVKVATALFFCLMKMHVVTLLMPCISESLRTCSFLAK